MTTIYIAEEHHQLLELWREQNASALRILHLDFHCDMRGLMIDRRLQRAYRIWDYLPDVDEGNFLTHAIVEGRVKSLRWVHDEPGGRQDDIGTVKYESDLTALPYRIFNTLTGRRGFSLGYRELLSPEWIGLDKDEVMDIDWDFFASKAYLPGMIQGRVHSFLNRTFGVSPREVYLCYSPNFCHPSRELFERFVRELAQRFEARIVELEPVSERQSAGPSYKKVVPVGVISIARRIHHGIILMLRKRGIY